MVKIDNDISIRDAKSEDAPAILNLLNHQYNNKFNQEYICWQYFGNEDNKLSCLVNGDEIIGMFGVLKKELTNGLIGLQASDMLIKEGYRGYGIFNKLADYAFHRYPKKDFLFVLPNLNGRNAIEKKLKWDTLFRIDEWQLTTNEFECNSTVSGENRNPKSALSFKYSELTLKWRFELNPLYVYKKIYLTPDEFAYIKNYKDPLNNKHYVDIVYFSSDNIQFSDLGKLIREIKRSNTAEINITTWALPGTVLSNILREMGFQAIKRERYFCISVCNELEIINNETQFWNLYQSDTEFY